MFSVLSGKAVFYWTRYAVSLFGRKKIILQFCMIGRDDISFFCKFDILWIFWLKWDNSQNLHEMKITLKGGISSIIGYVDILNKKMFFLLIGNDLPLRNIEKKYLTIISLVHQNCKISTLFIRTLKYQR